MATTKKKEKISTTTNPSTNGHSGRKSRTTSSNGKGRAKMTTIELPNISLTQLRRELDRREKQLERLRERRENIQAKLDDIDTEINELGGSLRRSQSTSGRQTSGRKRATNKMSLKDALRKVMANREKPMTIEEAAEAVQNMGYESTSDNFRLIVNQNLSDNKTFERVDRGQYRLIKKTTKKTSKAK